MIGVPRSGTTIISDVVSIHDDIAWFSNYLVKHRRYPEISLLNRVLDAPILGGYLRRKELNKKLATAKMQEIIPYPMEAYRIWDYYCRNNFSDDYLHNTIPSDGEKERIKKVIKKSSLLSK